MMNTQQTTMNDIPKNQGAADNFSGTTFIQPITAIEHGPATIGRVTFEKGARTVWHTHPGEQILLFLEGKGRVGLDGQPVMNTSVGDIVHIPPNTRHWHGAHPQEETYMRHLAITNGGVTWLEPVSEETYQA